VDIILKNSSYENILCQEYPFIFLLKLTILSTTFGESRHENHFLIEAESFQNKGG